jgi:DHA1 family tetracycline resistance protein-like MFS transporter
MNLAHEVLPATFVLYAGLRYGWNQTQVGLTLAGVGVCSAVVQAALVRRAVARFGERAALVGGLVFGGVGFAIYGLAPTGALFWLGVPVMALWGLAGPSAQGLMSRQVGPSQQGQLQGLLSSVRGIAGLLGPALFTQTFAAFIAPGRPYVPGAAFLLAALVVLLSGSVAWAVTRRQRVSVQVTSPAEPSA